MIRTEPRGPLDRNPVTYGRPDIDGVASRGLFLCSRRHDPSIPMLLKDPGRKHVLGMGPRQPCRFPIVVPALPYIEALTSMG